MTLRGALMVCGTTSDAGKSFLVTGLCRLLARRGVVVAPFKGQNMALNAAVTPSGHEIGHAQWVQSLAAGVEPEPAMNPVLLKPTADTTSQVVVMGRPVGHFSATEYHRHKSELLPTVLTALADLRSRHDVVICEGAGSPAEINLLDNDIVNLRLAAAAGIPALVVGDIDRGGVFASLVGTVELLPDELRPRVRAFVVNKLRGDPTLLGDACITVERRTGVPVLGVVPMLSGTDFDAEDSVALRTWSTTGATSDVLDVAVCAVPRIANFGDLDPLRLEPGVSVRWVRSPAELGRPDLVVLPGSKSTRDDLEWLRRTGLAATIEGSTGPVLAVCAGAQMVGESIDDPDGVEGPPGRVPGLGWLALRTEFESDKVLDRPEGTAVGGPGAGEPLTGYRIHHGRVDGSKAERWLEADDGSALGWQDGEVLATTLHGLLENDGFRRALLGWVAARAGKGFEPATVGFAEAREQRFDRIADALEANLDIGQLMELVAGARPAGATA